MSHKTKAAMQGRQCHYQKLKQSQDTRVNAGGQSLSAPVITGTAPLARLRCTALTHTPFPEILGDLDQRTGSTAMQHTPEELRMFRPLPRYWVSLLVGFLGLFTLSAFDLALHGRVYKLPCTFAGSFHRLHSFNDFVCDASCY